MVENLWLSMKKIEDGNNVLKTMELIEIEMVSNLLHHSIEYEDQIKESQHQRLLQEEARDQENRRMLDTIKKYEEIDKLKSKERKNEARKAKIEMIKRKKEARRRESELARIKLDT